MLKPTVMFLASAVDAAVIESLSESGFDVSTESQSAIGFERSLTSRPDLFVIDLADPDEAIAIIQRIRSAPELKQTLVLAIAEWGTGVATLALSNGADAFEPKPIKAAKLIAAVEKLLRPNLVMTAGVSED